MCIPPPDDEASESSDHYGANKCESGADSYHIHLLGYAHRFGLPLVGLKLNLAIPARLTSK